MGNEILREMWRVKDKISAEIRKDPDAYFRSLKQLNTSLKKNGFKIAAPQKKLRPASARRKTRAKA